ncbi:MAG: DUF1906 domain-containing protein [Acidobacteriota bacterium]|nr:DUF1906 domain-containing protein [Acidobacteriota bacterium]
MRLSIVLVAAGVAAFCVSARGQSSRAPAVTTAAAYAGFDRNLYPGDAALEALRTQFAFAGYWLTAPPGETGNTWVGKREALRRAGFGFLLLANGRLDREILAAAKAGTAPAKLGQRDAAAAVAAARREGFPAGAVIFLDQEEGGRLLPEQAGYLLGWTEALAATGFLPGVYASGQPVPDGRGPDGRARTITTIEDIRARVAAEHLHAIAFWVVQDACPPAPGCVVQPPRPDASGTPGAIVWQYAQSPRRPELTGRCAASYAPDGNCYSLAPARFFIDLDTSLSQDPSHGR